MKLNKELKIIFITLMITLICLVSFVGINVERTGTMKNLISKYKLGMDLEGYRGIELKVDESTKGGQTQDKTDSEIETNETEEKSELINPIQERTTQNYEKSKRIIISRLKDLKVNNYIIKQDLETGKMTIQIPEDDKTDTAVSLIQSLGKFEIKDTQTGEILMNNSDLKKVSVGYANQEQGVSVYLNIEFNKEGKEKLRNITTAYVQKQDEQESPENANTENQTEEAKTITMYIDDEEIMSTAFDAENNSGLLQLSIGTSSNNQSDIQDYFEQGTQIASRLNSGNLPIKFELGENRYILSDITSNELDIMICVEIVIFTLMTIYMVIKYKENGLALSILFIGFVALYLLLIRYTNVVLTIEGLFAIAFIIILQFILSINILRQKQITSESLNKVALKEIYKYIPIFIIAIVAAFSGWSPLESFGMSIFWGIVLIIIYHFIVTKVFLKNQND
ncbi:MAG: hypothetical protein Q4G05_00820 [Clostridia bacterium]|nr:hypothetical protein [Clostridia bacterium]